MRKRWILALLLATLAAGAARACDAPIPPQDLIKPGSLMLAINPTLPPWQFVNTKGELQGLNVELADAIAQHLCLAMDHVRMDFAGMFLALRAARYDGINTGMFWTAERAKVAYMVPYAMQSIALLVRPNGPLHLATTDDLAGLSVAVAMDSYQERWLRGLSTDAVANGRKPIDVRPFATNTDVFSVLRAQQVDAVAVPDYTATEFARRGQARQELTGLAGTPSTLAFRNRTVAEAVVTALNAMRADGTYDRLFTAYGMTPYPEPRFAIRGAGPD